MGGEVGGGGIVFLLREGGDLQKGRLTGDRKKVVAEVDFIKDRLCRMAKISLLSI